MQGRGAATPFLQLQAQNINKINWRRLIVVAGSSFDGVTHFW